MNYTNWLQSIPGTLSADPLWRMTAYRLALFCADVAWRDVTKLMKDKRTVELADQLYRSIGSIGANIAEGYSRSSGKDRVRFYEYALGSARESRTWYFNSRHTLGLKVADHRLLLLTEIVRLMLTTIPDQRNKNLREEPVPYHGANELSPEPDLRELDALLNNIPLP